MQSV